MVAAGCLVVLAGVALVIGGPWETAQPEPSQDVEVPPPPEGTVPEDRDPPEAVGDAPVPAVLCQPEPCERWRVDLPSGTSVIHGDTAYHVGRTDWRSEVTAIDLDTGAVRWRDTLAVPDAMNGPSLDGRPPSILAGEDDVIILAADSHLEARSGDGAVIWTLDRADLLPYALTHGPSDTIIAFAGMRDLEASPRPGWSGETILSIDITTGQLRWERGVTMPLSPGQVSDGVILALTHPDGAPDDVARPDGTLLALDASTGELVWEQPTPPQGFGISGSILQVSHDSGTELLDVSTGEPLDIQLPDNLRGFDVEVVGDLIAVRSYPGDSVPGERTQEPLQELAIFDPDEGVERFTTSAPGWVVTEALPDGGVVVASGEDQVLRLTVLRSDGHARWELDLPVPSISGWPRWPQILDDGTIAVIAEAAPGVPELAAHRFGSRAGEPLGVVYLDIDGADAGPHDLELRWPVVIDHRSNETSMGLHGPAGSLEIPQHVDVLSIDPLVIRTPSSRLARLDETLLLGGT